MKKRNPDLTKARIIIVDSDFHMAELLQRTLRKLGLSNISITKSGKRALEMMKSEPADILITEWDTKSLSGINLILQLRKSEDPKLALLPVIMLTARATKEDVMEARDMGVTEFLVKPYTTKTLYQHLENIIDFPRDFIVWERFTGPCRRRIKRTVDKNRRIMQPVMFLKLDKIQITKEGNRPMQLVAQQELRRKIGLQQSLKEVITPRILTEAQKTINSFSPECLKWVAEDVEKLEQAASQVILDTDEGALEECKASLLSMRAHGGTFNYSLQAETAYDIYKFLRDGFELGNRRHNLVLQKYVETIKIFLAKKVTGQGGKIEQNLSQGLDELLGAIGA
ncbi:MAG: response regulator [Rickettsiales bacterium]|nr:response regulator [Rickettsiales bacterium]